ncbi:TRAP transporter substrate-binding protein [Roseibium aestuarii]|uniref:TRAP transporter substrate-binding protein n=1 Tax=Roseibium aestuarii TaxID=2600299 RepID=A0ABW4JXB4_9HYPH|nr:TRAP transporter substrate-binding protein [Roseibium aestuarii]
MADQTKHPARSRRAFLKGGVSTGLGMAAAAALAAPAVATGTDEPIRWRLVTSWPRNLAGPGVTAQRICDRVRLMSGGRLDITLYGAGELVPALGVLDAVSSGTAEMGHSASFFWQGKMPASVFFTAFPFGLLPGEHVSWIEQGGGQELWDRLYEPFGVKPVMAGNTGVQMGGWFRKEIASVEDLKGLRIRMPGLGGAAMARLGAVPTTTAPGEIYQALSSGLLDAAEFLGPWSDRAMGFQQVASHYYAPGFHEPNGTGEALFNLEALNRLPEDLRAILLEACKAENGRALAESDWENAGALAVLQQQDGVSVRLYPADVLAALRRETRVVLDDLASRDEMSRVIRDSARAAQERLAPWNRVALSAFLAARDQDL